MILAVFLALVSIIFVWDYLYRKKRDDLASNIPGPSNYPLIGNLFVLKQKSPEDAVRFMKYHAKTYGKIVRIWVLNILVFTISDPKILEILLSSPKYIKKSSIYDLMTVWLGQGLLLSNGRKWFQRRKIITPTFHFKILEQFTEIFDEQGQIFVKRLEHHIGKGAFDVNPYVTLCALDVIAETALGTKIHAQTNPACEYAKAVSTMTEVVMLKIVKPHFKYDLLFRFLAPDLKKQQDNALNVLHDFTENIIEERRALLMNNTNSEDRKNDEDDVGMKRKMALLDVLLQSTTADGKPLTNDDIREEVDTFTFEGHDTTTAGVSFTLYCLSRHADVQDKAFAEIRQVIGDDKEKPPTLQELNDMKYLEIVIKESMRLYPPVPIIGRRLEEDLHLDNGILPVGSDITIPIFMISRDPQLFPEPDKFMPERFLDNGLSEKTSAYSYIPFSAGPRNCIGQKFAMLEMKSTVSKVMRNFELLPMGEEPHTTISLILRSMNGVNLGIRPRMYT